MIGMTLNIMEDISGFFQRFFDVFQSGNPLTAGLDIFLVAFVVFNAFKLIRETRAIQLLKGLILLLVVYGLVTYFNMQASSFLMEQLFKYIVIVLVVLFQPEIRHALESMGRSTLGSLSFLGGRRAMLYRNREGILESIRAVSRACSDMGEKKVGALIVFEKETPLGEIIKTGTAVDAAVTTELVNNIFYKGAPLHDGAMVIREGRICAAGCILPLTQNNTISTALGTRHRAALGMSEQCDAMIVVVSEESGYLSIAYKGILNRGVTSAELREKLSQYLVEDELKTGEESWLDRLKGKRKK